MTKCRYYPWCSYMEGRGCLDNWCVNYQPIPDVEALMKLADEMDYTDSEVGWCDDAMPTFARRIREAVGA